ncbi:hypothetical protein PVAP13_3NG195671 [Panicum virgatum]|uniref:Uncharacterized protein n=1 Tax=Panicum virgatum TaxID=38727 RepID=A0A8T0UI93_PANVG|nr:hypothetical protein PVAP13_3NG195671 [Panicum virgatum]
MNVATGMLVGRFGRGASIRSTLIACLMDGLRVRSGCAHQRAVIITRSISSPSNSPFNRVSAASMILPRPKNSHTHCTRCMVAYSSLSCTTTIGRRPQAISRRTMPKL